MMRKVGVIITFLFISLFLFPQRNTVKIENGKQGLTDSNGKILIPCQYDKILDLGSISLIHLAAVTLNNKTGLVTYKNEIVQPPVYDSYYISDSFIYMEKDSKWGAFKANGDVFLAVKYDYIGDQNSKGNTCVQIDNKWGLLDSIGRKIIPYEYDGLEYITDDLLAANLENKVGLIDEQNNIIIPFKYRSIKPTSIKDVFIVSRENIFDYCIINKGKEVFDLSDNHSQSFSDGLLIVEKDDFYGVVNSNGGIEVSFIYHSIYPLYGNIAMVKDKNSKCGFINKKGELIVPFIYDNVKFFSDIVHFVNKDDKGAFLNSKTGKEITPFEYDKSEYSFSSRVFVLSKNGKYGILDIHMKIVVPFEYQDLELVDDNTIIAEKDNKWGILRSSGEILVPLQYDQLAKIGGPFNLDSYILYKKNNKYGILNTEGKEVVPSIYDDMKSTYAHTLIVAKNGKYGLIDRYGNALSPIIFDKIQKNNMEELTVTKNGKQGILSVISGKEMQPCIYDSIQFVFDKFNMTISSCIVQKNGKWGIYTSDFKESIPCIYNSVNILEKSHETYLLEKDGRYGLISSENRLTDINFDAVKLIKSDFDAAYFLVTRDGKEGVISSIELQEIIPCQYDKITIPDNSNFSFYVNANKDGQEYQYRCISGTAELMQIDE